MVIPVTDVWRQDDRLVSVSRQVGGEMVQNHLGPPNEWEEGIGIQTNARHLGRHQRVSFEQQCPVVGQL